MSFLDYFRSKNKSTASVAKDRLQIIVAHERSSRNQPDYLPALQKDLVAVISKYVPINEEQVSVALDQNEDCAVLELNITLPEETTQQAAVG
ncbi:MAG: cell division topological specificity factor MinE [Gammaproteobacteria bacterium]|nr:MAG: cell division topological specificity factor MinE [Gammaproteobacteria bacterium]